MLSKRNKIRRLLANCTTLSKSFFSLLRNERERDFWFAKLQVKWAFLAEKLGLFYWNWTTSSTIPNRRCYPDKNSTTLPWIIPASKTTTTKHWLSAYFLYLLLCNQVWMNSVLYLQSPASNQPFFNFSWLKNFTSRSSALNPTLENIEQQTYKRFFCWNWEAFN